MIGSGLKKLALENGMKVASGVAYGSFRGYAATFSEGAGYKQIVFTTKFAEIARLDGIQAHLNGRDIQREWRVQSVSLSPNGIQIVFRDNPGTMAKIREFLDWFMPLLDASGATGVEICSECGMPVTGGCWKLIDGTAFHMHESCAQRVLSSIDQERQLQDEADDGSYVTGTVGAVLGAALGAVVWAIVLNMGYVASVVGLLIGWLAEKGYTLLKGKQGKVKIAILILAVILGVVLGTVAADVITVAQLINENQTDMTYGDIPMFLMYLLESDAEYRGAVLANIGQGLLFAALGVFALFIQETKNVSGTKVIDLK